MRSLSRAMSAHRVSGLWVLSVLIVSGVGVILTRARIFWSTMKDIDISDLRISLAVLVSLGSAALAARVTQTASPWLDTTATRGLHIRQVAAYLVALASTSWPWLTVFVDEAAPATIGFACQTWGVMALGSLVSLLRPNIFWMPALVVAILGVGTVLPRPIHPLTVSAHPEIVNLFWGVLTVLAGVLTVVVPARRATQCVGVPATEVMRS